MVSNFVHKFIATKFVKLFLVAIFISVCASIINAQTEKDLTLAMIVEDDSEVTIKALTNALNNKLHDAKINIQDQSLTDTVIKTLPATNRLNLPRDDARRLGSALGSDFFLVAKFKSVERADVGVQLYGECYAALYFVATRSGKLLKFEFLETRANTKLLAIDNVLKEIEMHTSDYAQIMRSGYQAQFEVKSLAAEDLNAIEPPDDNDPIVDDFEDPEITVRKQPEYTAIARKMAISAVVEASVILRKDGNIGTIEITKWAGFGLDEAAVNAIKQLKFKPAKLDEKPINCKALIRYNFNYKPN